MLRRAAIRIFAALALGWSISSPLAHQTTDSYLSIRLATNVYQGRWAISLRDLNHVLTIDSDDDGEVSDPELSEARPKIQAYAFNSIIFQINGLRIEPALGEFDIEEHADAIYAALTFTLSPPRTGPDFLIEYKLFAETDPLHRGLLRFDLPKRTETAIFSTIQPHQRFFIESTQRVNQFLNFLKEGAWHIWIGFDHIVFLVALLLPSVLVPTFRAAIWNIVKVVTSFTVAHSITLSLAALGLVTLPARLVESTIAFSVVLAAIHNIKPLFPERTCLIAFGFGLIHGFGFAGVLGELDLDRSILAITLLAFNLGVEFGQTAIVLVFIPIAFAARNTRFYRQAVLRQGSALIALVAGAWLIERVFDWKVLPF